MAQKQLALNMILNGQIGPGFNRMAMELNQFGNQVNQIGSKLMEWEKESVEVYKNYETYMLEAKGALSAQYDSASKLNKVMDGLDASAQEWASSTIFHTNDVSQAISEAAHAGWSYEQMLSGIPAAMKLAQAGNISLSQGLDYVIKTLNATGLEFDNAEMLIDQWAMAANSGATNISELGDALTRMGATTRFAGSTAELFTMLDVLANSGTVGADAGTLLRNSMLRLIAPTEKASKVMGELAVSESEMAELASDSDTLEKASKILEGTGFSAYTSTGELKDFLTIYKDLHAATKDMTEEQRNEVLSAIFPTRTISGALALLEAAADDYDGLLQKINNSEGYADKVSDIQMSGLMGSTEIMMSKLEELQRKFGEVAAEPLEAAQGFISSILDGLNGMDKEAISGLTWMFTSIAGMGTASLAIGGVIKLFGTLGWAGSAVLVLGAAAGYAYGYLSKLSEIEFNSHFGDMAIDADALKTSIAGLTTPFDEAQGAISRWANAAETANRDYETFAETLSEDLLTDSLTGKTLTDAEVKELEELGGKIAGSVMTGIQNAEARDLTLMQALFGDKSTPEESAAYETAADVLHAYYSDLYTEAEAIGQTLRDQMTAALVDKNLSPAEREAIQKTVERLNQIEAQIQDQMAAGDYYSKLHRAQRVSMESVADFLADNEKDMNAELDAVDTMFDNKYGDLRAAFEWAINNGKTFNIGGVDRNVTWDDWALVEGEYNREWQSQRQAVTDKYSNTSAAAFDAAMMGSKHADAWAFLKSVQDGTVATRPDGSIDWGKYDYDKLSDQLLELDNDDSSWFGLGKGKLSEIIKGYTGNEKFAAFSDMLDMAFAMASDFTAYGNRKYDWDKYGIDNYDEFSTPESRRVDAAQKALEESKAELARIQQEYDTTYNRLNSNQYQWWDIFGAANDETALYGNGNGGGLQQQLNDAQTAVQNAEAELAAAQQALEDAELNAPVTMSDADAAAEAYVNSAQAYFDSNHMHVQVDMTGEGATLDTFAEGGRADEPSIFGEAGPEWAIPEEHTQATADLLTRAAAASGFSWGSINTAGSSGSTSTTSSGSTNVNVSYAPVVYANDSSGVEDALRRNLAEVKRMVREALDEADLRNTVGVYV